MIRLFVVFCLLIGCVILAPASFAAETAPENQAQLVTGMTAHEQGDYTAALEILKPLAEDGEQQAQFILGLMYENGQGVAKSNVEAARWFFTAATQGNIEAAQKLSTIIGKFPDTMQHFLNAEERIRLRQATEDRLVKDIEALLGGTVGSDNVRATVSVVLDFNGDIKRATVAILVDGYLLENDQGELQYQSRPIPELELLETLARGVVGFDENRGDTINVVNMEFAHQPELAEPELELVFGLEKHDLYKFAQLFVIVIIILVAMIFLGIFFIVIRIIDRKNS
jgi:hypothetical protein